MKLGRLPIFTIIVPVVCALPQGPDLYLDMTVLLAWLD